MEGIFPDTGEEGAEEGRCSAGPDTFKPGEIAGQGESWEMLMLHTPWGDEFQDPKRKYGKKSIKPWNLGEQTLTYSETCLEVFHLDSLLGNH